MPDICVIDFGEDAKKVISQQCIVMLHLFKSVSVGNLFFIVSSVGNLKQ